MKFVYQIKNDIIIEADTEEEAQKKLAEKKYAVAKQTSRLLYLLSENGTPMQSTLNRKFNTVWYESACPCEFYDCILDPAKRKAEKSDQFVLTEKVKMCSLCDKNGNCLYYDDEDK